MSKKSNKKQIRAEKKQAGEHRQKRNSVFFRVAVGVLIALSMVVLYEGFFTAAPVYNPDEVSITDHTQGAADAPVTMTVYADFECSSCQKEAEVIARAWSQIRDNTRFVFRYYPLDTHRYSFLAARYAEAASKQDKFWGMHDLLFGNQQLWATAPDAGPLFDSYAEQLAMDMDQLKIDLESNEVRAKIIADQKGGTRAGVRGTPVMFLNGRRVDNPRSAGELVKLIDGALAEL